MTALTGRAHDGDRTESPEMWEQDSGRAWTRPYISDGQAHQMRRAQQDGRDESATNTQLKTQAESHAGTAQPGSGEASGSGISSDSALVFICFQQSLLRRFIDKRQMPTTHVPSSYNVV